MGSAVKRSPAWLICGSANALHRLISANSKRLAFGQLGAFFDLRTYQLAWAWGRKGINARLELAAPVERYDLATHGIVDDVSGPSLADEQVKARKMDTNAFDLKLTPARLRHGATAGVFARGKLAIGAGDFKFQGLFCVNNGKAVNLLILHCNSPYGPALAGMAWCGAVSG